MTLLDFNPRKIWFATTGIQVDYSVDLSEMDGPEIEQALPFEFDLKGEVKDSEWRWDGVGQPKDWSGNSITQIVATDPFS